MPKPSQIYRTYESRYYYLLDEGYSEDEAEDLANDEEAFDIEISEYDDTYNTTDSDYSDYNFNYFDNDFEYRLNKVINDIDYLLSSGSKDLNFEKKLNKYLNYGYDADKATKLASINENFTDDNLRPIFQELNKLLEEASKLKITNPKRSEIINKISQKIEQLETYIGKKEKQPKHHSHKNINGENTFILQLCFWVPFIIWVIVLLVFD